MILCCCYQLLLQRGAFAKPFIPSPCSLAYSLTPRVSQRGGPILWSLSATYSIGCALNHKVRPCPGTLIRNARARVYSKGTPVPGYIHTFKNTIMRNCSWADLTEDEFGEQWIHGTSAEPKTRKNICAGVADGVKHKVKEHSDWLAI